jgi:hypothetical protein
MKFMHCNTCSYLVQVNPTGICLGCQRGFNGIPQEDAWVNSPARKILELEKRKEEVENALQEQKAKSVPVRKQPRRRKRVSKAHTERGQATNKSSQKEEKEKIGFHEEK